MLDLSIFKKNTTANPKISTIEAFYLWNTLKVRYTSLETNEINSNFVHDTDFTLVLTENINVIKEQILKMEELCKKYKVKVPSRPAAEIKFTAEIDSITDHLIFSRIYSDLKTELYSLSRGVTSTTFNDTLRSNLIQFMKEYMELYEELYKYGKLKGWTEVAPAYITNKAVQIERLSVSEASHIWDHLSTRYNQMQVTQFLSSFIHDADLRSILDIGLAVLKDQVQTLEKKSVEYEVPLPQRPPAQQAVTVDPETFEDQFGFQVIFKEIREAINLHLSAVVETVRNDSLRDLFNDFLIKELDIFDDLIKYGKAKGWLHVPPVFNA